MTEYPPYRHQHSPPATKIDKGHSALLISRVKHFISIDQVFVGYKSKQTGEWLVAMEKDKKPGQISTFFMVPEHRLMSLSDYKEERLF